MNAAQGPGRRFFIVDEDRLRQLILDFSPALRHDAQHLADMIGQMVNTERQKLGLDNPRGTITLYPNKQKEGPAEPELIGKGYVAGRFYRAMAWTKADKLKISLLPEKAK